MKKQTYYTLNQLDGKVFKKPVQGIPFKTPSKYNFFLCDGGISNAETGLFLGEKRFVQSKIDAGEWGQWVDDAITDRLNAGRAIENYPLENDATAKKSIIEMFGIQFHAVFGMELRKYWHPVYGFNSILFDHDLSRRDADYNSGLCTYKGESEISCNMYIEKRFGSSAVKLVNDIMDYKQIDY